jgi:hypothetical protein
MTNRILFYLSLVSLGVFLHFNFKERTCKTEKKRVESLILQKTINIIHMCPINSARCVNNAVLFRLENLELMNAELRDLGCN